ncbi:ethanolamine ammonia-lyase subunit EutC [Aquabacterium sp. OR-4]|uniref:ethanolamine ammonia-lyase subunit EutC n=1 Tax=Aquabacterium sp. OR-4 TaxID=2978127 RepID=UPI0021B3F4BC|nr:ethanolamine ammonia-lyase subunit EutC [Aquabacterium sp. OR-4]MDT7838179.1 ethanolamine ammonia-lyase subunit EutC [Aquabacterium sp. OR-4]
MAAAVPADPWLALRAHTPARIALGRSGASLPTREWLGFAAAHALARDAVQVPLDTAALRRQLSADGWPLLPTLRSRAPDRASYLRRPDWGRRLQPDSAALLQPAPARAGDPAALPPAPDLAIVLGDGPSALALQSHAAPLLAALREALGVMPGRPAPVLAPLAIAEQARVALADEVGALLNARLVLMLLGERPGLSSPDSLGAYLTHAPAIGCTDAQRNCVSNIRPEGLAIGPAAQRIAWLVHEALRRRVTGIALKDDSGTPLLAPDVAAGGPAGDAGAAGAAVSGADAVAGVDGAGAMPGQNGNA